MERKIRVAITHGDTNGIGYEVIMKTFSNPAMFDLCIPIVYGSPKVAAYHSKALGLQTTFSIIERAEDAKEGRLNLLPTFEDEVKVDFGQPTKEAGEAALKALDRAMTDFRNDLYDVLVTAPINKQNIKWKITLYQEYSRLVLSRYILSGFCKSVTLFRSVNKRRIKRASSRWVRYLSVDNRLIPEAFDSFAISTS